MKLKKTLFSRILKIFILMSIGSLILTMAINTFVSRVYFKNLKISEVQPTLSAVGSLVVDVENGVLDYGTLERFIFAQTLDKNTQIIISDESGNIIFASRGIKDERLNVSNVPPEQTSLFDNEFEFSNNNLFKNILSSSDTYDETLTLGSDLESMVIGQSIKDSNGNVIGAVAAIVPVYELDEAVYTLMISLAISMSAVMLISVFVLYLFSKKLTKPIHTMMQVAQDMSHGEFTALADESDPSEIGALGISLNRMSESLKAQMEEILAERSKLELMLTSMKEGVISFNQDGQILVSNPAVYQLLEVDSKEELTKMLEKENIQSSLQKAFNGKFETVEFKLNEHVIGLSVSPIYTSDHEISAVVAVFTDQSEAQRLEQMRRDYVANVSHELRTPITAMRAFIEPLNDDLIKDEAKKHEYYNNMLKEIERLNRLINDLLELSRLQSVQASFKEQTFNFKELMNELVERYSFLAKEKNLELKMEIEESIEMIHSNEDRLEQVLTILLDNAFKYTEKGFVHIKASKIHKDIIIEVMDSGIGIAQKDLPYIFERFYTVDKARTYKSFGLGLSIANEITEHLGARLSVTSKLNEGTCFILKLNQAS